MFEKNRAYFDTVRLDIINLVEDGDNRILDVGCGTGRTSKLLKEIGKAIETVGIEKDGEAAKIAVEHMDRVVSADIQDDQLKFDAEYFDYILLGDILEHLYDPWSLINRLTVFLKINDYMVASIPNVRHILVILNLLFGKDWKYADSGVLDNTHLRFFTKKTMVALFNPEHFIVESIKPSFKYRRDNPCNIINKVTLGLLEDFISLKYLIKARRYK